MLIATCRTTHPDLVITDLKMLDGDEGTAMEAIWQDERTPVIVISAFPQDLPE
jgi:CheY-like chemotaxis protein